MSSIIELFVRRGAFFVAAALEVFCAFLIIRYNSSQAEVADATREWYSAKWMEQRDAYFDYTRLRRKNEQLLAENAKILSRFPNAYYTEEVEKDSIQDDSLRQRYTYISAEVINKTPLSGNINYVINRGYIHGVEPHQGVINEDGVVGITTAVSARHARVMSLCHRDFRLSAQLRGKHFFGSLSWGGGDTRVAQLAAIPEYAPVVEGDTVETTGYSNIFPTGIPIGEVASVAPSPGETTLKITINLFIDFFELEHAYVVRDLMKEDLEQLDN